MKRTRTGGETSPFRVRRHGALPAAGEPGEVRRGRGRVRRGGGRHMHGRRALRVHAAQRRRRQHERRRGAGGECGIAPPEHTRDRAADRPRHRRAERAESEQGSGDVAQEARHQDAEEGANRARDQAADRQRPRRAPPNRQPVHQPCHQREAHAADGEQPRDRGRVVPGDDHAHLQHRPDGGGDPQRAPVQHGPVLPLEVGHAAAPSRRKQSRSIPTAASKSPMSLDVRESITPPSIVVRQRTASA